jgi:hypothetical protein
MRCVVFALATLHEHAMLNYVHKKGSKSMTTKHFDATPTPNEPIKLDNISTEKVKEAWKSYEAKPEYKEFNKHDMIEAMQKNEEDKKSEN